MAVKDLSFAKMKEICLALPGTAVSIKWGQPHFVVGKKIFAGYGEENGRAGIGFKLEKDHQAVVLTDPRFTKAAYVGAHGWVSMEVSKVTDWEEVRALVHESYRLIAPKRLAAQIGAASATRKPRKR